MRLPTRLRLPLLAIAGTYLVSLVPGFFAPYDPTTQYRNAVSLPPAGIHWRGADGKLHLRPVVYEIHASGPNPGTGPGSVSSYPIELISRGVAYKLLGVFPCDRHLFTSKGPGALYLMGTDGYGRDVFSRVVYGGQISLFAGLLATALALGLGTLLGTLAGFYGKWTDIVIMRTVDLFLALPWMYLLLGVRAFLPLRAQPYTTFLLLISVIGIVGWARPARIIRGLTLSIRERPQVLAARSFGASDFYILRRHVLPETTSVVVTQAALLVPQYVLAEVTLSFLGLGIPEPLPSWGNMLTALQQYHVLVSDWWMFFPGLIMVLVFAWFGSLSNALQKTATSLEVRSMRRSPSVRRSGFFAVCTLLFCVLWSLPSTAAEELQISDNVPGTYGGRLVVALRSEPKTLNPVVSTDVSSREVIGQMTADLIHINRYSQQSESALAKSWSVSRDGLHYSLALRQGLHFSDGAPLDADDVLFTFKVYLDEKVNAPQRDSLVIGNKPITVRKSGPFTLIFDLAQPYASAERLFDSIAILPRHLLEAAYSEGKLAQAWNLNTQPAQIAGLGPFRLKQYVPGQRITLERNPYYGKADQKGNRLPYLDQITFLFVGNEDAEVLRFESGETDVISRLSAENFAALEQEQASRGFRLYDVGPGLEYNFLLLNLNSALPPDAADIRARQAWFSDTRFRQALSLAIDRNEINRIVYKGRGSPIWTSVPPGNRLWFDEHLPRPAFSIEKSRELLKSAAFAWGSDGLLRDAHGAKVDFSILTSASSTQRNQMAVLIQQDLKAIGIAVQIVPFEFRAMLDRVLQTHNYDTAIMGLGGGDVDPNSQLNVWLSSGDDHFWRLGETQPATSWEAEIDKLLKQQMSTLSMKDRKRLYDRVQEIEVVQVPVVFLVSPNVLVGARLKVHNFKPAVLDSHTLWNSEQLFFGDQGRP